MSSTGEGASVGMALALTVGAGLSTTIGACIPWCVKLSDKKVLASSLGFAAGVMVYVSLLEILPEACASFQAALMEGEPGVSADAPSGVVVTANDTEASVLDKQAAAMHSATWQGNLLGTLLFFVGCVLTWLLDGVVHGLERRSGGSIPGHECADPACADPSCEDNACADPDCADPECGDVSLKNKGAVAVGEKEALTAAEDDGEGPIVLQRKGADPAAADAGAAAAEAAELQQMGSFTAAAIFIHNVPEGMATFVGALANANAGFALACAIAVHNIPEGVCVAMPIYHATGSRTKAFLWAFGSGVSEPIGGLIGYFIMVAMSGGTAINHTAFGLMFAIVAGMMVFICVKELLPTALRYDPADKTVTKSFFAGMAVMAVSIVLFEI